MLSLSILGHIFPTFLNRFPVDFYVACTKHCDNFLPTIDWQKILLTVSIGSWRQSIEISHFSNGNNSATVPDRMKMFVYRNQEIVIKVLFVPVCDPLGADTPFRH
jgi:hypothetical protein